MRKTKAMGLCLAGVLAAMAAGGCGIFQEASKVRPAAGQNSPAAAAANVPATAEQRTLGSLATEAAGPGGGWIIGATPANITGHRVDLAQKANQQAEQQPAAPASVENSDTADLNRDGFVTLDEVLALKRAGLSSNAMIDRIRRTGATFELSDRQQRYLRDRGVEQPVIDVIRSTSASTSSNLH